MTQDNEHIQTLVAARNRELEHRRDVAKVLAEKYNRGDTEKWELFVSIQSTTSASGRGATGERAWRATRLSDRSPISRLDLPAAIKQLEDRELDQLLSVVLAEQKRRDRKLPVSDESSRKQRLEAVAVALT